MISKSKIKEIIKSSEYEEWHTDYEGEYGPEEYAETYTDVDLATNRICKYLDEKGITITE